MADDFEKYTNTNSIASYNRIKHTSSIIFDINRLNFFPFGFTHIEVCAYLSFIVYVCPFGSMLCAWVRVDINVRAFAKHSAFFISAKDFSFSLTTTWSRCLHILFILSTRFIMLSSNHYVYAYTLKTSNSRAKWMFPVSFEHVLTWYLMLLRDKFGSEAISPLLKICRCHDGEYKITNKQSYEQLFEMPIVENFKWVCSWIDFFWLSNSIPINCRILVAVSLDLLEIIPSLDYELLNSKKKFCDMYRQYQKYQMYWNRIETKFTPQNTVDWTDSNIYLCNK